MIYKTSLIVIGCLLTMKTTVLAQTDSSVRFDMKEAGKELKIFSTKSTSGVVLQIAGLAVIAGASASSAKSPDANLAVPYIIGGGLSLFGTILQLNALTHAKKASIHLTGEGLSYRIKSKKE